MPQIPRIKTVRTLPQVGAPRMNPASFRAPGIDASALQSASQAKAKGAAADAALHGQAAKMVESSMAARDRSYQLQQAELREEEAAQQAKAQSQQALASTFNMVAEFGDSIAKVGKALYDSEQETIATQGTASLREEIEKLIADYKEKPDQRGLPEAVEQLVSEQKATWMGKLSGRAAARFGAVADNIGTASYVEARNLERKRVHEAVQARDAMVQQRLRAQWAGADWATRGAIRQELQLNHKGLYDTGMISKEGYAARLLADDLYFNETSIREVIAKNPKRAYDALTYVQDHPRGTPAKAPEKYRDVATWVARLDAKQRNALLDLSKTRWEQNVKQEEQRVRYNYWKDRVAKEDYGETMIKQMYEGDKDFGDVEQAYASGKINVAHYNAAKTFNATMHDHPPNPRAFEQAHREIILGQASVNSIASAPVPAEDRVKLLEKFVATKRADHYSKQPGYSQGLDVVKRGMGYTDGYAGTLERNEANRLNAAILEYDRRVAKEGNYLEAADEVVAKFQAMDVSRFRNVYMRYDDGSGNPHVALMWTKAAYKRGDITRREYIAEAYKIKTVIEAEKRNAAWAAKRIKNKKPGEKQRTADSERY